MPSVQGKRDLCCVYEGHVTCAVCPPPPWSLCRGEQVDLADIFLTATFPNVAEREAGGGPGQRCISLDPAHLPANLSSEQQLELGCRFAELSSAAAGWLFRANERRCRLCGTETGDRETPYGGICGVGRALLSGDRLQQMCTVLPLLPPTADPAPTPATTTAASAGPTTTNGTAEPPPAAETLPPPTGDRPAAAAAAVPPPPDAAPVEAAAPAAGNGSSVPVPAADSAGAAAAEQTAATGAADGVPGDGGQQAEEPAEGETAPLTTATPPTTAEPPPAQQKESVFVRLSNRIKALELNMSLSQQYLDELSRRYKKQVEEMQKTFNKTLAALEVTGRWRQGTSGQGL